MSDFRVDTASLERKYGLHSKEAWNVTPAWQPSGSPKRWVTLDNAGAAADVVRKVVRFFEARTMAQHAQAVEFVEDQQLLWDAPDIRLTNKQHLRVAAYLAKYIAAPKMVPTVLAVSEPSPGCTLIELDSVVVIAPHKGLTWLLPSEIAQGVHSKIGINGSLEDGKVELMVSRFHNLAPIPPLAWQRGLVGVLAGALPHALEGALGYVFDAADGGDYYARKRNELFKQRHPGSTNPTWDWLTDLATVDLPTWAGEEGTVVLENAQAVVWGMFEGAGGVVLRVAHFYLWLLTSIIAVAQQLVTSAPEDNKHRRL